MNTIDISYTEEVYSVSRLNREVRLILEGSFPIVWVEGEISNFAVPHSGHWYFSLKDANAQIRCAMFKPNNRRLDFVPKDGMQILVKARVSLYEGRGDFQLLIEHLEEAGEGKLRQEFEALKKRLSAAGLFDTAHKKPLPNIPLCIGIVTSATGAAVRDILTILKRRFPCIPVIIYPTIVQGESAAANIVTALQTANRRQECDVIILARGGGSLEDLWPFNEERVAYAIYRSEIPIISGVGHEIDFTIADFVADLRAPTPSAAAELVAPERSDLLASLTLSQKHFIRTLKQKLQHWQHTLVWMDKHLRQQHPKRRLTEQMQQLDFYELRLVHLQKKQWGDQHAKLQLLAAKLDTLSPLATLKRGFSITTLAKNQKILQNTQQVKVGDEVHVQLSEGQLKCSVNTIHK